MWPSLKGPAARGRDIQEGGAGVKRMAPPPSAIKWLNLHANFNNGIIIPQISCVVTAELTSAYGLRGDADVRIGQVKAVLGNVVQALIHVHAGLRLTAS